MKQKFNPKEWLDKMQDNSINASSRHPELVSGPHDRDPKINPSVLPAEADKQCFSSSSDIRFDVDTVIARIEAAFTDITGSYAEWVNLGFAFANEFGESGRSFFKRISRFYPGYTLEECNKQYDRCLKAQGHGITIRSFFHMAKQAGIDVETRRREKGEGRPEKGEGKPEKGDRRLEKGEGKLEKGDRRPEKGEGRRENLPVMPNLFRDLPTTSFPLPTTQFLPTTFPPFPTSSSPSCPSSFSGWSSGALPRPSATSCCWVHSPP